MMRYDYFINRRNVSFTKMLNWLCGAVVLVFMFVTSTRLTPLEPESGVTQDMSGQGSALRQSIYLLSCFFVLLANRPLSNPMKLLRFPVSLLIVLAWCTISLSWSVVPDVALRRLILTLIVIWCIFRAVDCLGHDQFLRLVCYACIGLLIANFLAVAISPAAVHHINEFGDNTTAGAWRGIIPHKNGTGPLCAITLFLLVFGVGNIPLVARLGLIAADLFFLFQSHSKTSLALSILAIGGGYLMKIYNPRLRVIALSIIAVIGAVAAVLLDMFLPPYLDELDSSMDAFTGRIQIWRVMLRFVHDHLMLGAGFSSFWNAGPNGPIYDYANEAWILGGVAEGHNGYLDILVQLGLVGLILTVFAIFIVPIAKLIFETEIPDTYRALMFTILFFAIGHNFTETSLLATDQFMQLMLVIVLACIDDIRQPARATRHEGVVKWLRRMGEDVKLMLASAIGREKEDKKSKKGNQLFGFELDTDPTKKKSDKR